MNQNSRSQDDAIADEINASRRIAKNPPKTGENLELEAAAIALYLSIGPGRIYIEPHAVRRLWALGQRLHLANKLEGQG